MGKTHLPDNIGKAEVDSTGAIIAKHPSQEELDAIRKACVYHPTGQNDITLDYDSKWYNTSVCYVETDPNANRKAWKYIVISPFIVPRQLRNHQDYVKMFATAASAHEAGHIIFSKPLWPSYRNWNALMDSPICAMIVNILEDARINDWLVNGVGGSIGLAWEASAKWMGRVWLYGFEQQLHSMRKGFRSKFIGIPPGRFMVSAISMVGLYGQYGDNERLFLRLMDEYFPRMPDKYWVDFARGVKILREAAQHHSWKGSLEKDCNELYLIFAKYTLKDSKGGMGCSKGSKQSQPSASQPCNSCKSSDGEGSGPTLQGPFNTIEEAEAALKKSNIENRLKV